MNAKEILALVNAGFTKEEIMQLVTAQAPEGDIEPPEDPIPQKQPPEAETPKEPEADKRLDSIVERLDKLSSGMETLALRNTQMPERETAEDALAKIINPYLT